MINQCFCDKVIAVPTEDPRFTHMESLDQLAPHFQKEVQHFFETMKALQNKVITIEGFEDKAAAEAFITETREAFSKE